MLNISVDAILWIKAFHLISAISWMAGLLYLPRLFVYHAVCDIGGEASETFKIMEQRLLRIIMNPAAAINFILGGILLASLPTSVWAEGWLWLKLICVVGLVFCHFKQRHHQQEFANDRNIRSQRYFKIFNEVPTVLMLILVIMVVVKPL